MTPPRSTADIHPAWACFSIALGVYPMLIAFGVVRSDPSDIHAPMWVVALAGGVFVIAGAMMLLAGHTRLGNLLGGLLCLCFAAVGAWVSLLAPSEGFSGGVPLLSSKANVTLARWMFGCGTVLSFGLFVHAVRLALRRGA